MHSETKRTSRLGWRRVVGTAVVLFLALAALSAVALAQDEAPKTPTPAPGSALSAILDKLHNALAALDDRVDGVGWTGGSGRRAEGDPRAA